MKPHFIESWDPGMVIGLVAVVLGVAFLIVAISVIPIQIRKFKEARLNSELMQNMLDQGMAIDEIERVLDASRKTAVPWYAPQQTIKAMKEPREAQTT